MPSACRKCLFAFAQEVPLRARPPVRGHNAARSIMWPKHHKRGLRLMGASRSTTSNTQKLAQRNRELSILNGIAEALNRTVDMDEVLGTALAKVAELLGLHTGWVWLLDEEGGESD